MGTSLSRSVDAVLIRCCRFKRHLVTTVTVSVLFASAVGCRPKSDEILIGAVFPLSGSDSTYGIDVRDGVELALERLNAAGGIKSRKVRILIEDDKSNAQDTSNQVRRLIDRDKVIALIAEVISSRSLAAGLIANTKKIPMVNPISTAVEVTKDRDYVFRTCFTDAQQGRVGARFVYETLKKTTVGIIFAAQDTYSSGLAQTFKEMFTKLGGKVVAEKAFQKGETNFTTYLQDLKAANTDVLFAPVFYTDMIQIAHQARQIGIQGASFMGADGWDSTDLLDSAGTDLEGAYFTNHYAPDVPSGRTHEFMEAFRTKYKREANGFSAQGFDAASLLFNAIERAPETTSEAIKLALAGTKDFAGATGVISIDKNHNPYKPIVVIQVLDKKFRYSTQLMSD